MNRKYLIEDEDSDIRAEQGVQTDAKDNGQDDASLDLDTTEDDDLAKAMTLMQRALEQYEEGRFDMGRHTRILANKYFEKVDAEMDTEEGREKSLYGENLNFGVIYRVLEENLEKMYRSVEGRKILGSVTSMIKESKVLKDEFTLYGAFDNTEDTLDIDGRQYVNEVLDMAQRHSKDDVIASNRGLLRMMKRFDGLNECVVIDDRDMDVFDAVEFVLLNERSMSNISEYAKVKSILAESITPSEDNDEAVDDDSITDDEKLLVDEYTGTDDKEGMFNSYKDRLICTIDRNIKENEGKDSDAANRLNAIKEQVASKRFTEENGLSDIAKFAEVAESLS